MRDENPHRDDQGARPRAKGSVAFRPKDALGFITLEEVERLARAMRALDLGEAKLTADQRFLFLGLGEEQALAARKALGAVAAPRSFSVHACPGSAGCANGLRDTISISRRLEALFSDLPFPAKVKVGVSGCPRCCAESMVRDLGLIGRTNGWTLAFGGNAGITPRSGDVLASGLSDDDALDLARRILHMYLESAPAKTRTARFAEREGIDALRTKLGLRT